MTPNLPEFLLSSVCWIDNRLADFRMEGEDTTGGGGGGDTVAGAQSGDDSASGGQSTTGGAQGGQDTVAGAQGEDTLRGAQSGDDTTKGSGAPPQDWRDRRIAQLTARLRESEAARTKPTDSVSGGASGGQESLDSAELDRLVQERATDLAAQNEFVRQCNEVARAGRTEFPDFDARVNSLFSLVDRQDAQDMRRYNDFLAAAIETGEGTKILHALGGDLNEAARVMALSPVKQAAALAALAAKPGEQISGAPKPITPVGQRGQTSTPIDPGDKERSDKLSTAEWMKRREAQVAAQPRR